MVVKNITNWNTGYWLKACRESLNVKQISKEKYEINCSDTSECFGCQFNTGSVWLSFNPTKIKNWKEVYCSDFNKPEELKINNNAICLKDSIINEKLKPYYDSKEEWWTFNEFLSDLDTIIVFQLDSDKEENKVWMGI